ncbi:MAG: NUDIX hydrolase [Proteobacteria bacterium]|nr:NUDIX hydrolase [Pseudomonadota bacterium]
MSNLRTVQGPIRGEGASKQDPRSQFAALCFRRKKKGVEILLISSRDSERWIIPKGWPMDGKTPAETAGLEAWEEAGVCGTTLDLCVGLYSYSKEIDGVETVPCIVSVFPVEVKSLMDKYPEVGERRRKWFSAKKAASKVREPDLKAILKGFLPPPPAA